MKKLVIIIVCLLIMLISCNQKSVGVIKEQTTETTAAIITELTTKANMEVATERITEPTTIEVITTPVTTEAVTEPITVEIIENPDFRNTKWGDSPETVIAHETADFFDSQSKPQLVNNALAYTGKIARFTTNIFYFFDSKQQLYLASYDITEKHTTNQIYIVDYDELKKLLTEKYGTPYEDEIITLSNAASLIDEGKALEYGYKIYRARWKTNTTEIMLGMMADNYKIGTIIQYTSIEIVPEADVSGF